MSYNTLQARGGSVTSYSPKTASVAIKLNSILAYDGSGGLTPATSSSTLLAGISLRAVVSTDSDYALTTSIPFVVLDANADYEIDVTTGTATPAMVGNAYALTDDGGLNVNSQTHAVATIVGFISATKVVVNFNGAFVYKNAS